MSWEKRRARLASSWSGKAVLWLCTLLYGAAVVVRRALYEWRILTSRKLGAKVISIGNLTTGGTGKTPAVLLAAQTLRKRNHPVAIVSRGYGRKVKDGEVVALLDDKAPDWTICGDEPWMMHHALQGQGVPVLVCADKAKAGHEAVTYYHSKLVIVDDGFQHLRLKRDLDVVLVNARDPFGGGHLLPLGNLREPAPVLSRADLIVITHADRVGPEALAALKSRLTALAPKTPVIESAHKPDFLLDVKTEERHKLSALEGRSIVSLCGLGDPGAFEEQLQALGAKIAQRWRYPDHHPYKIRELRSIEKLRGHKPLVTTFKDFTRLPRGWQEELSGEVFVLAIKLDIMKGRNIWIDTLLSLAPGSPS